ARARPRALSGRARVSLLAVQRQLVDAALASGRQLVDPHEVEAVALALGVEWDSAHAAHRDRGGDGRPALDLRGRELTACRQDLGRVGRLSADDVEPPG